MAKKNVKFMCTAFRDGFQSVYGTRVLADDFFPAVEAACAAGITYFEVGGGAMFQAPVFYMNSDPYAWMQRFRDVCGKDANLQTLSRGVNIVALDSASSDVIRLHAQLFKKYGISTIRNFDALNDVNNLIHSGKCIVEAGLNHQVVVTMMALPPGCKGAHNPDFYEKTLRGILDAGIPYSSVCFKDASGTTTPAVVHETIKRARKMLPTGTQIQFHSHETAGCSILAYKAALDAGADAIDLSLSPVSGGTCSPDVIVMWHALNGTDYDLGVNIDKVRECEQIFRECMKDYFLPPEATSVDPMIPWSPMPGGALTANTQMLRDNNLMSRYSEMIDAMSEVVQRGGFGTSVTPVSQFYFQQSFNNVLHGPWKKIAPGYGKMVLGYFGKTPVAPDPEIVKIAAEQLKLQPTTKKVLEINDADPAKSIAPIKKTLEDNQFPVTDENIFLLAACGDKGLLYLQGKATVNVRKNEKPAAAKPAASASGPCTVSLNGKSYGIEFKNGKAFVNGREYAYAIKDGIEAAPAAAPAPAPAPVAAPAGGGATHTVKASLPGVILRITASIGKAVKMGDEILVLESMKMEIAIKSPADGTVSGILVSPGDKVNAEAVLATIA